MDPHELEELLRLGKTTDEIAAYYDVTVNAVKKAKQRWGLSTYMKLEDEEIDALIFTLPGTFSMVDGYREIAARFRYAYVFFFYHRFVVVVSWTFGLTLYAVHQGAWHTHLGESREGALQSVLPRKQN